jgi:hypothetical protein
VVPLSEIQKKIDEDLKRILDMAEILTFAFVHAMRECMECYVKAIIESGDD